MEKSTPHYRLADVKTQVASSGLRSFTFTALRGVEEMGLEAGEALAVVAALSPRMFHKSMTTYANHRLWQDVYHAPCPNGKTAYIKLTMQDGVVVIQFKEK
jgi:motility quorum-sensing regulator/GCU-specific mRNA interferase toxin